MPLAPEEIDNHGSPLVAVHAHPLGVLTATVPDPPLASTVWFVGDSCTLHTVPDWVTRARIPLMVMSACRMAGAEFADT